MRLIYHGITKNGGIEPPFLVAIPPQPTAVHSPPKGSENPSVEDGDSRDSVED